MKNQVVLLLFIVSATTSSIPTQSKLPASLLIESTFYPSFHSRTKIKIYKAGDWGYLTFTVFDKKENNKIISADSIQLTMKDFQHLYAKLGSTSILKFSYDTIKRGFDGITLVTRIQQDGETTQFRVWSPHRDKFIDAIFNLLNENLPQQENYIEDIQAYFNYGLPVKIKNSDPFLARIYGSISIEMDSEVQKFFKKVPKHKRAIIDLTNFWGMGTIYDEDFEEFDLRHPKLIWVIPSSKRKYFGRFGLDSLKMVESLDIALQK